MEALTFGTEPAHGDSDERLNCAEKLGPCRRRQDRSMEPGWAPGAATLFQSGLGAFRSGPPPSTGPCPAAPVSSPVTPKEQCPQPDSPLAAAAWTRAVDQHAERWGGRRVPGWGGGRVWSWPLGAKGCCSSLLICSLSFLSCKSGYLNSLLLVLRAVVGEAKEIKGRKKFQKPWTRLGLRRGQKAGGRSWFPLCGGLSHQLPSPLLESFSTFKSQLSCHLLSKVSVTTPSPHPPTWSLSTLCLSLFSSTSQVTIKYWCVYLAASLSILCLPSWDQSSTGLHSCLVHCCVSSTYNKPWHIVGY